MFLSKRPNGVYYLYYQQLNGKRTAVSTKSKLKSEALKFLIEFKGNLDKERKVGTKSIPLSIYINEFLKYSESLCSNNTIKTYQTTFKVFLRYTGEININSITSSDLTKYFEKRIKETSIYQARKDRINLSSLFSKAVEDGYLTNNPCKNIKQIKIPEKQPRFFTEEEFKSLIKNINNIDIEDIAIVALNTGLRQMELITLEWNQVDFKNNLILLDNRNYLTKSKKVRSIPINEKVISILIRRRGLNHVKVFTIDENEITQKSISNRFSRLMKKANMRDGLNFHSLRHTFASWLIQRGSSIYHVSKLLGHSNIKTTEIYAHLRNEDLQRVVNSL